MPALSRQWRYFIRSVHVIMALFLCMPVFGAEFSLRVDRTIVEEGQSIELSFSYNGESRGTSPDFSALSENFELVSIYPSSQRYNINGKTSIINQWILQAIPKKRGQLLVPPVYFKGQSSQPITIEVKTADSLNVSQDVFIETIVDKSSAYVNEHITLSFRLYYDVDIDNPQTDPLDIDNVTIQDLPTKQYQRRVDGRLYQVAEFSYLLEAKKDGTLVIPQLNWRIRVNKSGGSGFFDHFGRYEVLQKRSQEKIIRIKAIPDSYPPNTPWIPASSLEITQTWTNPPSEMKVGIPNTRRLEMHAQGIKSNALPVLLSEYSDNELKMYAESPELEDRFDNGMVYAHSVQNAAVILNTGGDVTLPELRVAWWNVERDTLEYALVSAVTLAAEVEAGTLTSMESNTAVGADTRGSPAKTDSIAQAKPQVEDGRASGSVSWLVSFLVSSNLGLLLVCAWLIRALKRKPPLQNDPVRANTQHQRAQLANTLERLSKAEQAENWHEAYTLISQLCSAHPGLRSYQTCIRKVQERGFTALVEDLTQLEASLYSSNNQHFSPSAPFHKSVRAFLDEIKNARNLDDLPSMY